MPAGGGEITEPLGDGLARGGGAGCKREPDGAGGFDDDADRPSEVAESEGSRSASST